MSNSDRDRQVGEIITDIKWIKENMKQLNKKMDNMVIMTYQNRDQIQNVKKIAAVVAGIISFFVGIIVKFVR